jgi:hypothetical protein
MLATQKKVKIKVMKLKFYIFCVLSLVLFGRALAQLPDTLLFSPTKYIKTQQLLYSEPVKRVCLRGDKDSAYPSAVFFSTSVVFLDKNGREAGKGDFPESKEVKVIESSSGEYIYLFGASPTAKQGGFHRLYRYDGKLILSRDDSAAVGPVGLGIPLESQNAFLMGGSGQITLTTFDGKLLASRQYLNPQNYEDGDIFLATSPGEQEFYAVINKFQIPDENDRAILYCLDSKLGEIFRDTLDCSLASSPLCTQNGDFINFREECDDNTNPSWIFDATGHKLMSLNNPRMVAFASASDYFIGLSRDSGPEIFSSANLQASYKPVLPSTDFPWNSIAISSNGSRASLFNGDAIVLINTEMRSWSGVYFPFAFDNIRLYDRGNTIMLRGEFGFVIYKSAK